MTAHLTGKDQAHLARALELAEGGRGQVSPNPLVGAVIVRGGVVVGEGFHARLGDLHAERAALVDCRERGEDPRGATMYVTLEPCAHEGRQPPCADALVEAGIARVVIGSDDPSAKAAGRGPERLRAAGIEVEFADDEVARAARLLNQPFRKHARTGLPLVTLKLAMSLDGRTTTPPGASPWISGEQSRALVHRWRAESDAIAVGINTALADNPRLTARPDASGVPFAYQGQERHTGTDSRQPLRVVFDRRARLPLDSQLLRTLDISPVLVLIGADADPARVEALRAAGAEVAVADDVPAALALLGERGVTSLFLEGGRTLAAAFQAAGAIDEARTFVAPVLLGAGDALRPAGSDDAPRPAGPVAAMDTPCLTRQGESMSTPPAGEAAASDPAGRSALSSDVQRVGEDVLIVARFEEW